MKKEDITSAIIYLLLVAGAIIAGTTVVQDTFQLFPQEHPYLLSIVSIVAAIIVNVIGLELFHCLGAKIGGYEVVSINMVGFCFEKTNGKWSFKFKDFDGLTGETKIVPKKEKRNLKPFMWTPLLAYVVEVGICVLIYSLASNNDSTLFSKGWMAIVALQFIIVSSMIALYNIVPLKLDSTTDGYRLVLITKKINVEAFDELMRVEDAKRNGKNVGKIKVFDEITDFSAMVNLLSIYDYLNNKKYDDAEKLIANMLAKKESLNLLMYQRLLAQQIYILIMKDNIDDARKFYNENFNDSMRRFIANDNSMESLRAYALIAGFLDESESEVMYTKSRLQKILKETPKNSVEIEEKLFKEAIDKISKAHKDWFKKENAA